MDQVMDKTEKHIKITENLLNKGDEQHTEKGIGIVGIIAISLFGIILILADISQMAAANGSL